MKQILISFSSRLPVQSVISKAGLVLALWVLSALPLLAQMGLNAPAGLAPRQDMEIYSRNSFLVQQKFSFTTADPNASVNTLSCATSPPNLTAQAGILKDPGADSDYPSNLNCAQRISRSAGVLGYEVVFEDLDTEANDDLVIITAGDAVTLTYSGSTVPPPFFMAGSSFRVRFVSNNNITVGRGFRLRWREVNATTTSATPTTAFGRALQFDVQKGALLSGLLLTDAISRAGLYSSASGDRNTASGDYSSALGRQNTASGIGSSALGVDNRASSDNSSALGLNNTANGIESSALGIRNTASGFGSSALGYENTASGDYATALGNGSTAAGQGAIAIGAQTTASGRSSMALGNYVSTNNQNGAVILGDNSTTTQTNSLTVNQYTARFAGGYRLFSNSATTLGVSLAAGGNSWATISDSTKKERFRPVNGPALLRNIGAMKLGTWNYIGQRDQRHYGPMAQEFFAQFGHDELGTIGCDTLLNSHDFTAVTFTGVQALVKENEALKAEIAQLRAEARRTDSRLEALETLLPTRRRAVNAARK